MATRRSTDPVTDRDPDDVTSPPPATSEPTSTPGILFLCVHNAGRSQMAAAFARHLGGDRARVLSAGSAPADEVNPVAVAAMAEAGIDMRAVRPRRWTHDDLQTVDVVVTMGCGDACPFVPDTEYVDWPLTDPAGQGLDVVREVRDDIERRVRDLLREQGLDIDTMPGR